MPGRGSRVRVARHPESPWMSRLRGIRARFAVPASAGMTTLGQL